MYKLLPEYSLFLDCIKIMYKLKDKLIVADDSERSCLPVINAEAAHVFLQGYKRGHAPVGPLS